MGNCSCLKSEVYIEECSSSNLEKFSSTKNQNVQIIDFDTPCQDTVQSSAEIKKYKSDFKTGANSNKTVIQSRKSLFSNIGKDNTEIKKKMSMGKCKEQLFDFEILSLNDSIADDTETNNIEIKILYSKYPQNIQSFNITPYSVNEKFIKKNQKINFGFSAKEDVEVNLNDPEIKAIQFAVFYCPNRENYYLCNSVTGKGAFIKIHPDVPFEVKNQELFSFGPYTFLAKIKKENCSQSSIKIEFNSGPLEGTEYEYSSRNSQIISIGRSSQNTLSINSIDVSKIQCLLYYEHFKWFIKDGDVNKPSSNGLWYLANHRKLIQDAMVFKSGNICFIANKI